MKEEEEKEEEKEEEYEDRKELYDHLKQISRICMHYEEASTK